MESRWFLDTGRGRAALVDVWGRDRPVQIEGDFATIAAAVARIVGADLVLVEGVGWGLPLAITLEELGVRVARVQLNVRQGVPA